MKSFQNTKIAKLAAIGAAISLFSGAVGYAAGEWENIWVQFDSVNLKVNGQNVTSSNFLYNDRTYVPLRACAEMLGSTVEWSQTSNTASIVTNTADSSAQKMEAYQNVSKYIFSIWDLLDELHYTNNDASMLYYYCNDSSSKKNDFAFIEDQCITNANILNNYTKPDFNKIVENLEILTSDLEILGLSKESFSEVFKYISKNIDNLNLMYDSVKTYVTTRDKNELINILDFEINASIGGYMNATSCLKDLIKQL